MKLIIIDDEPIQHFIIRRMIKVYFSFISDVDYYVDASLALEYLTNHKSNHEKLPDIIIVDLHMSLMSGREFLNNYDGLHNNLTKSVKIYIMSSSLDPEDIALSKKYPFVVDYITKPVTKIILQNIFEEFTP